MTLTLHLARVTTHLRRDAFYPCAPSGPWPYSCLPVYLSSLLYWFWWPSGVYCCNSLCLQFRFWPSRDNCARVRVRFRTPNSRCCASLVEANGCGIQVLSKLSFPFLCVCCIRRSLFYMPFSPFVSHFREHVASQRIYLMSLCTNVLYWLPIFFSFSIWFLAISSCSLLAFRVNILFWFY